jgi:hypothetical protein
MPKIKLMVPETESTIVRPIVTEVARQLMDMTGINKEHTQIFYPRENGKIAQPGSTLTGDALPNTLPFDQRVAIEVEEVYQEEDIHSISVHRPENRLIFLDNDLDTVLRPVYVTATMTLNFKYRAADETSAKRWRDDIYVRMALLQQPHLMQVTYNYAIPDWMIIVLQEIHRLREANHGYGQDWPTYFNDNSSKLLSVLSNLAGKEQVLAMSETQVRIPAVFDFTGAPEKGNREDGGEAWTISFSYKFQYAKAVACQLVYPLVVHNTPMDEVFRPKGAMDTPNNHLVGFTASSGALAQFESGSWSMPSAQSQGYAIPAFDEFMPEYVMPATQRVMTAIVLLDKDNPQLLMNLAKIDENFEFRPDVLNLLRDEVPSLAKPYQSIFHLSLYRNVNLLPADVLEVDFNLDVKATRLLSERYYYHVRLSMVTDLRRVDRAALDRARSHGRALVEILKAIEPTLEERGVLPVVDKNNYVTRADLEKVIRVMERGYRQTDSSTIRQFNTVQTLFVKVSP